MIGKIMKNLSFKATTKYVIKKEGAQIIGGNMAMETPADLAAEFAMSKGLKPMIKRPVYHFSLSLPPTESLTDEQFAEVATQYLMGMGLDPDENQYFVARHVDKDHDHIHIVASRINLSTGAVVDDGHDYCQSQKILRGLEHQFGLTVLENSWDVGKRAESIGQIKKGEETGEVSVQKRLQTAIEAAVIDSPTMPELIERLHDKGIGVKIDFTRTGKQKGISYTLDDVPIAGNKLGNRYSFPGLSKHLGVDYDAARDNDRIVELCARVVVKPVPLTPAQKAAQDEYDATAAVIRAADPQSVLTDEQIAMEMSKQFHLALKPNQALSGDKALVLSRSPLVQIVKQSHGEKAAKARWQKIIDFGVDYAQARKAKEAAAAAAAIAIAKAKKNRNGR